MTGAPLQEPAESLVQVALDILRADGLERLSLREIARRAGVSHSAPLRHFPTLADLLREVARRGFRTLYEAVEKAGAQLPPGAGPRARLAAGCRAYVETAVANPELFALMFRADLLRIAGPELAPESELAFGQLVAGVRAAQDDGFHPDQPTRVLAGSIWSTVHGLATLWSQGAFRYPTGASLDEALDSAIALMIPTHEGDPP